MQARLGASISGFKSVIVELVELRKTNNKDSYEQALSHLDCSMFTD